MKDFLPVIYPSIPWINQANNPFFEGDEPYMNIMPRPLNNQTIGIHPRYELASAGNVPAAGTDRGRGVTSFSDQGGLFLDEDSYFYSGGSQDLTATTGNGYAGNTGFNEEYTGSFVRHLVSGVENLVIVNAGHTSTNASANHGNVWYVANGTSAPSSISDAVIPCNNGVSITRGGASLDGYFIVCDITGKIYNSALNDITTWTATNFITAEREPDTGVFLGQHHNHIVYIGTRSIEFFYNAGNTSGSPLARRADVQYSIGCYVPNSIVQDGDVIYFVGTDHAGWSKLYKLENFQLVILVDDMPKGIDGRRPVPTKFNIASLDSLEHKMWLSYMEYGETPGLMLTYDYLWTYYWDSVTGLIFRFALDDTVTHVGGITAAQNWNNIYPIMSYNYDPALPRYQLINGRTLGLIGTGDNDTLDDWGTANNPEIWLTFPRWNADTDMKKRINWVRLISHGAASDSTKTDPFSVGIRWYDYDRKASDGPTPPGDYTTARNIDANLAGAKLGRQGTTRERQYLLDFKGLGHGPIGFIKGLEIDYEIVGQ